jgi:small subunit ribosomal protein S2
LAESIPVEDEALLIPLEDYLAAGLHIGTSSGMNSMEPFIYRVRSDGLFVLDVRRTDERIKVAAKFLSRYDPSQIAVCSVRTYAITPVKRFCKMIGATTITGRFIPGTFTNPSLRGEHEFAEPSVILVTDPHVDSQAIKEATDIGIPVIALCDSDNVTRGVDLVIPCNNKGRNSLAMIFWLLTRQLLREKGEITPEEDLSIKLDHFRAPRGRRSNMEMEE